MEYTLILTQDEREGIDWIGHRYSHGNDLFCLLTEATWERIYPAAMQQIDNWDEDDDIMFVMNEKTAKKVKKLIDESLLDCFSGKMVCKLREFAANVT